ncbi:hypothetical protein [Embleya sp. NPDC059237]|uniref:hypothetical protein n=1 Tax=Embleya sp. NPDC059237 TaxID=3346784 RepID=UPI0036885877
MPATLGTVVIPCPTCHRDVDVHLRVLRDPTAGIEVAPETDHVCTEPREETA